MHKAYSHLNTYVQTESWHVETGNVIVNAVFGGTSVGLGIGVIVLAGLMHDRVKSQLKI
jgi:uncharacterized membrane-anchored protein YitT (DUF2179 family)